MDCQICLVLMMVLIFFSTLNFIAKLIFLVASFIIRLKFNSNLDIYLLQHKSKVVYNKTFDKTTNTFEFRSLSRNKSLIRLILEFKKQKKDKKIKKVLPKSKT